LNFSLNTLKNKHFIKVWSVGFIQPQFLNMECHKNVLHTALKFILVLKNFRLFKSVSYLIWIFFIFSSKIHGNLKFLQKNLKVLWHILDRHVISSLKMKLKNFKFKYMVKGFVLLGVNLERTRPITKVVRQKWSNSWTNGCILHFYNNLGSHPSIVFLP